MVDASHEKEARAKETISQLKTEISNLSRLVEQGAGLSVGQENTVNELLQEKEELAAQRDSQLVHISEMRAQIASCLVKLQSTETDRASTTQEIRSLRESISSKKAEQEREDRRRERVDKETKELRSLLELRGAELKARSAQLASASEKRDHLGDALRAQRTNTERGLVEVETVRARMVKLLAALDRQQNVNVTKIAENIARQVDLRRIDQEITNVRQAVQQKSKFREAQQKRLNIVDQERAGFIKFHETLNTQATSMEREIEIEQRETTGARKQVLELEQELKEVRMGLEKAADSTQRQVAICRLNASMIRTLEGDVGNFKQESTKHRKMLYQFEKQREKYGSEASSANAKFVAALEEVGRRQLNECFTFSVFRATAFAAGQAS
mmetsp:Transcript_9593/g.21709  ORF Transcript_9593/g.21709 Transcript_9593/m.21709 type:complete len:385 (-) Transcript_9593:1410-2564(-)